jgi:hypothetical protein
MTIVASFLKLSVGKILAPGAPMQRGAVVGVMVRGHLYRQPVRVVRVATRAEWLANDVENSPTATESYFYEVETD